VILFSLFFSCSDQATPPPVEPKPDKHVHAHGEGSHDHSHENKSKEGVETDNTSVAEVPVAAKIFFSSPKNGEKVTSPVTIKMGVEGMQVKPAGELEKDSGHHHIIIDADSVAKGTVVPADDNNKHYGKGQTETTLELTPGEHTLRLQFADGIHRSYGPKLEETIKITVTK
jgi:hypothetical protein